MYILKKVNSFYVWVIVGIICGKIIKCLILIRNILNLCYINVIFILENINNFVLKVIKEIKDKIKMKNCRKGILIYCR